MAKELYVGHLAEETTEEDLRRLFSVMGMVTSIHLIVDPDTKEFKRCGYVRMAADIDVNEVVETLDGAYLIDRVITVSVAKPQKDRPPKTSGGPRRTGRPPAKQTGKRPEQRPAEKRGAPQPPQRRR